MIYDCFTFYNELDMLNFRFDYLYDVVDYFVLVEANYSHKGNRKKLFYGDNKELFKKYEKKIIHIIVDDMPNTENAWDNEKFQRKCINRGLMKTKIKNDDIIIISDVDEIPDRNTILNTKTLDDEVFILRQNMYYYNIFTKQYLSWTAAKICNYKVFCDYNSDASRIRLLENYRFGEGKKLKKINNGGWHFSYFGTPQMIKDKINTIVEGEPLWKKMYNKPISTDIISIKIKEGKDLYGRRIRFNQINPENNNYLPEGYEKYNILLMK